jgi:hypothetical protein
MKKILTIVCLLMASVTFGQNFKKSSPYVKEKKESPIDAYVSYGLSLTNSSDFRTSSYTGLETGIMYKNLGAGVIFGRGSLKGLGQKSDNLGQYFYEVKTSASMPLGDLSGSVIFGYGGYFNSSRNFIEYGAGISYKVKHISYGVMVSNWDGVTYVTPNITYNF